jgi:hypothetical protein
MKRFHVPLHVDDLGASIAFDSTRFGGPPAAACCAPAAATRGC